MAMTYAALAKTLGLSLGRSTQASTSSQPSNTATPVSTAVTTEQEETQAKTHEKSKEILEAEPEPEPQSPSLKRKSDEGPGERSPTPVKKAKSDSDEGAVHVSSDEAGPSSDADAEGETDIASSRPPSPYTVPPQSVVTAQKEGPLGDGERPKIPSEDTEEVHETLMEVCKSPVTTNNTAPSPPITPMVEKSPSTNDTPSHSSFPDKKLHSSKFIKRSEEPTSQLAN